MGLLLPKTGILVRLLQCSVSGMIAANNGEMLHLSEGARNEAALRGVVLVNNSGPCVV